MNASNLVTTLTTVLILLTGTLSWAVEAEKQSRAVCEADCNGSFSTSGEEAFELGYSRTVYGLLTANCAQGYRRRIRKSRNPSKRQRARKPSTNNCCASRSHQGRERTHKTPRLHIRSGANSHH